MATHETAALAIVATGAQQLPLTRESPHPKDAVPLSEQRAIPQAQQSAEEVPAGATARVKGCRGRIHSQTDKLTTVL